MRLPKPHVTPYFFGRICIIVNKILRCPLVARRTVNRKIRQLHPHDTIDETKELEESGEEGSVVLRPPNLGLPMR